MGARQIISRRLSDFFTAVIICVSPNVGLSEEAYPSHPIKIVVPVAVGGAPDVVSRIVAQQLSVKLGQPVIIENRPGAGERIGAEFVARADPDGYTLLAAPPGSLVIGPLLYSHLPYDPSAFVPVTILTTGHLVLLVRPTLPVSNIQEFVALAKASPGKITYASPGAGTPPHLTGEMFNAAAGIHTTHVPYKGLAPALADVLAGHVDVLFDNLGNSLSYIRDGRLKVLGVASEARIPELPDVPAIAETYPGVQSTSWFGIVAPPKTPLHIVERLSQATAETLRQPDVVQKLHSLSFTPVGNSPAETTLFMKRESERWRQVVKSAGIQPE